jgi:hypothetical protein
MPPLKEEGSFFCLLICFFIALKVRWGKKEGVLGRTSLLLKRPQHARPHGHLCISSFVATCVTGQNRSPPHSNKGKGQGERHTDVISHSWEQKMSCAWISSARKLKKFCSSEVVGMSWSQKEQIFGKVPVHTRCECCGSLREPSQELWFPRRWLLELVRTAFSA